MTLRRAIGSLLIAVSLVGLVVAFLDLPVEFHLGRAATLFVSRSAPVFWLAAALGLGFASHSSMASRDRRGSLLGFTGLCLLGAYLCVRYVAGLGSTGGAGGPALLYGPSHSMLAAVVAVALSVATTILGWHLVMIPAAGASPPR